jgi:hypothetical protein
MDSVQIIFSKFDDFVKQYDLFAFDFDLTILKIHAYANDIKATDVEAMSWKKIMDHFADPIFFRDLVNYLISQKKKVAIVSFGTFNVIKAYLDRLFDNPNIFGLNNIITPLDGNNRYTRSLKPDSDKNQLLIDLVKKLNLNFNRVIFFDDDEKNITHSKELGLTAVKIDSNKGFNRMVWLDLINSYNSRLPQPTQTSTPSSQEFPLQQTTDKIPQLPSATEGFENPPTPTTLPTSLPTSSTTPIPTKGGSKNNTNTNNKNQDLLNKESKESKESKENKKLKSLNKSNDNEIIVKQNNKNESGEKKNEEKKNEENNGFMSYYMNWINILAVVFIAIYWIIEKFS